MTMELAKFRLLVVYVTTLQAYAAAAINCLRRHERMEEATHESK